MRLGISKKFAKRSIKCLALFAPLAYLFGSLFFGLNGAHGQQLWAEPLYVEEYIDADTVVDGYDYRLSVNDYDSYLSWLGNSFVQVEGNAPIYCTFQNGNFYERIYYYRPDDSFVVLALFPLFSSSDNPEILYQNSTFYSKPWVFYFSSEYTGLIQNFYDPDSCTLSRLVQVPTENVSENNSAFTDFTFGQFFPKDNFLEQWGENAISDNPKGFAPFGAFLKFIDSNMLHFTQSQIGLMGYGYIYYCAHVLIAFLAFDCIAWIPALIEKALSAFNKGVDD